jgi:benzoyl-CoA reductase/2-hydroxyglutaryl-CoA dehydratase subunit BcrC/BadD/HgdB
MSSEDAIRSAIERVTDLHRSRFELWRADDRPKVGWVSAQTPEEILIAAGVIPFRLTGETATSITDAGARLATNYCSYVLSCLSEGLDGEYQFVDGVVFNDACDMRKRLWEAWARDVRPNATHFLELPNDASDASKAYFATELRKWIRALEHRYGRSIGDDDLKQAIALCNRSRALMQRVYEHKKRPRPIISGRQSIQIVKAATTGLKEPFNASMELLLEALERAEPRPPSRFKRPRVLICGSYFDQEEIIDIIEGAGADLVCEDISNGVKYFEGAIDLDGDPVAAIARYYLDKYTSARRLDTDVRLRHLLDLVREYQVDSVIYYVLKFCDTNLHEYPYIKDRLRAQRVTVLLVEGERNATNIAGTKTRIQTFLEPRF